MKALLTSFVLCLVWTFVAGTVLHVALDGSQQFTQIQAAIDASAHTDTVLVSPGRYFENVRFYGKNITLASLELTTGDPNFKYLTIIDGNHVNSVIQIRNGESNVTIRGFSIVNGDGFYDETYGSTHGGGLLVGALSGQRRLSLINCVVADNYASSGGGLQIDQCYLTLSGVTIRNNKSSAGGGMFFAGSYTQYTTTYDPVNRCSIYNNYAANGSDLYYYMVNSVQVIVDTFTVANPWNFYATAIPSNPNISNPYTFDILNTVHQEVNHDLYVATWGDDANSGLSPTDPMRSVFMAMYRIATDSNDPKTVHLANGIYSTSQNGQFFPIPVKSHTSLIGESKGGVLFDVNGYSSAVRIPPGSMNCRVASLVLLNSRSGVAANYSSNCSFDNITADNVASIYSAVGMIFGSISGVVDLKDVSITNVESQNMSSGVTFYENRGSLNLVNVNIGNVTGNQRMMAIEISTRDESDILIDGCVINNNNNYSPDVFNTILQIAPFDDYGTRLRVEIKDSSFYNNYQVMPAQMAMVRALNDTLFITNCTFAGNTGGTSALAVQGTSVLTNNNFWNPTLTTEVYIPNYISSGINSNTTFRYNNIRNGINGIVNATPANPLIWGEGNTSYDPMFTMQGNNPYTLSANSPLIDAGWQYASGLAEPGWDAGGNERLLDGDNDGVPVIDIGAYEFQPLYAPSGLTAMVSGVNVWLDWQMPETTRSLSGYRIYRNGAVLADISDPELMAYRDHITQTDTLTYQVVALYGNVESAASNTVTVYIEVVGIDDEVITPGLDYVLAYPNPFREFAILRIGVQQDCDLGLEIYNLRGQKVKTLQEKGRSGEENVLVWNADDDCGKPVAPGIYICRVLINYQNTDTLKLIYIK